MTASPWPPPEQIARIRPQVLLVISSAGPLGCRRLRGRHAQQLTGRIVTGVCRLRAEMWLRTAAMSERRLRRTTPPRHFRRAAAGRHPDVRTSWLAAHPSGIDVEIVDEPAAAGADRRELDPRGGRADDRQERDRDRPAAGAELVGRRPVAAR